MNKINNFYSPDFGFYNNQHYLPSDFYNQSIPYLPTVYHKSNDRLLKSPPGFPKIPSNRKQYQNIQRKITTSPSMPNIAEKQYRDKSHDNSYFHVPITYFSFSPQIAQKQKDLASITDINQQIDLLQKMEDSTFEQKTSKILTNNYITTISGDVFYIKHNSLLLPYAMTKDKDNKFWNLSYNFSYKYPVYIREAALGIREELTIENNLSNELAIFIYANKDPGNYNQKEVIYTQTIKI